MKRWNLGACALLLVASTFWPTARRAQEVVGHLPTESPYVDAGGKHLFALQAGWILTGNDYAGVGPKPGLMFLGRYEYDVTGPLWITGRVGLAPGLARDVKDPLVTGAARNLGERVEPLFFLDGGLSLSLTGEKAWRGLNPRLHGNLGLAASLNSNYDVGGYRFGPKFTPSWGLTIRGVTGGNWEWNADFTHIFWRMEYPGSYTDDGSTVTPTIIGDRKQNPWSGNVMLSFGITRVARRR